MDFLFFLSFPQEEPIFISSRMRGTCPGPPLEVGDLQKTKNLYFGIGLSTVLIFPYVYSVRESSNVQNWTVGWRNGLPSGYRLLCVEGCQWGEKRK